MNDTALPSEFTPLNDAATAVAPQAPAPVDPWAALSAAPDTSATSAWLDAPVDAAHQLAGSADTATNSGFQLHRLWDGSLPVESWIN